MTDAPRFVRFTAPFWFGMEGYFDEQDGTVIDFDNATGRQVLIRAGEVDPAAAYVGVVHTGSVLPVARFDEDSQTVAVRFPEPWDEIQDGLPLDDPDVIVAVDAQVEESRIEALTQGMARELFPGEFDAVTQDGLDAWSANWDD